MTIAASPKPSGPEGSAEHRARELRAELSRRLAYRGVAAVAEIREDAASAEYHVEIRPLGVVPNGHPIPEVTSIRVGAEPVDRQVRRMLARIGVEVPHVDAPHDGSGPLWCTTE